MIRDRRSATALSGRELQGELDMAIPFRDRHDAGRCLAPLLSHLCGTDVVVLGLPRGGVPVAFEVAAALVAPLDVIFVRKLGTPRQPELAMGAIGEAGVRILNPAVISGCGILDEELAAVELRERSVLDDRVTLVRRVRPRLELSGRVAVVVDDGIATGSTARAACRVARAAGAAQVVLAVPVGPPSSIAALAGDVDELVCAERPAQFSSVGEWYVDFSATPDAEVLGLLERWMSELPTESPGSRTPDIGGDVASTGDVVRGGNIAGERPPDRSTRTC
jgi:putative phosphoribosyl transferase